MSWAGTLNGRRYTARPVIVSKTRSPATRRRRLRCHSRAFRSAWFGALIVGCDILSPRQAACHRGIHDTGVGQSATIRRRERPKARAAVRAPWRFALTASRPSAPRRRSLPPPELRAQPALRVAAGVQRVYTHRSRSPRGGIGEPAARGENGVDPRSPLGAHDRELRLDGSIALALLARWPAERETDRDASSHELPNVWSAGTSRGHDLERLVSPLGVALRLRRWRRLDRTDREPRTNAVGHDAENGVEANRRGFTREPHRGARSWRARERGWRAGHSCRSLGGRWEVGVCGRFGDLRRACRAVWG